MPNLPQFATSSFYQDGQGKSLRDDIGIFERVCFSRDIVGKYMCVDCIERQLSLKKNRVGGPGAKGAGGPKPDLSQVGQSPAVHCSALDCIALHFNPVHCRPTLHFFDWSPLEPCRVVWLKLMILHRDETIRMSSHAFRHTFKHWGSGQCQNWWR